LEAEKKRLINGDTEAYIQQIGKKHTLGQRDIQGTAKYANKQQDVIGQISYIQSHLHTK